LQRRNREAILPSLWIDQALRSLGSAQK